MDNTPIVDSSDSQEGTSLPTKPHSRLRTFLLLVLGGFILLGPAYQEWLGGKNKAIRKWSMFHTTKPVCVVEYFQRTEDGERLEVDRFEVLDVEPGPTSTLHRIPTRVKAIDIGYRMCRAMDSGVELFLEAQCASRNGWRQANRGEVDMCEQDRNRRRRVPRVAP